MSNMTNINIRVDAELKDEFSEILDNIGLSVSSALNVFIKAVVRERKIPFALKSDNYTPDEREALAVLDDPHTPYYDSAEELFRAKGWL